MESSPFAPSTTTWRRERLTRIGSSSTLQPANASSTEEETETSTLRRPLNGQTRSYGTLPSTRQSPGRRRLVPPISLPRSSALSSPNSPTDGRSPSVSGFRELAYSRLSATQRPISAYDVEVHKTMDEPENDAKINGVRVWYSSFSSIDWLHDAIKDSVRFSRLRKRKTVRARARLYLDKSMGWFIVTIVGFLQVDFSCGGKYTDGRPIQNGNCRVPCRSRRAVAIRYQGRLLYRQMVESISILLPGLC